MTDGSERREQIRLRLEFVKTAAWLAILVTIVFAVLQWKAANDVTAAATMQRVAAEWRDHINIFVENPQLRPYFEMNERLRPDDPNVQLVLALADVRIRVIDSIMEFVNVRRSKLKREWQSTFVRAFQTSPVLCSRFFSTAVNYGIEMNKLARAACFGT